MKRNHLVRNLSAVITAVMVVTSVPVPVQAAKAKLSMSNIVLSKGDKFNLDMIGMKEKKGVYETSSKKVAKVTKKGGGISKESW